LVVDIELAATGGLSEAEPVGSRPRHAGVDFRADAQTIDAQGLDDCTRCLAAGNDELPNAELRQSKRYGRQRLP
jgi:hypothetical protein